jgi:serine/threonine protein kinase
MFTNIDLSLNKILGEGGYGTVYEGVWRKKPVAIKRIHLSDKVSNKREEEALKKLDHPNVIKLLYVGSDSDFR